MFNEVLENLHTQFEADHTYTLILRLRHNVIKTGIRMISLSYSRISLAEIARKLTLGSSEDAEFIVAKVIVLIVFNNFMYVSFILELDDSLIC